MSIFLFFIVTPCVSRNGSAVGQRVGLIDSSDPEVELVLLSVLLEDKKKKKDRV